MLTPDDARGTMVEATNAEPSEDRVFAFPWDETPLGPPEMWPDSLRAAVDLMLSVGTPSALFVGPERVQMHNRAFDALYRDQRSAGQALGRRLTRDDPGGFLTAAAAEVFAGRSIVLRERGWDAQPGGKALTFSCAPLRDEGGQVGAMLVLAFPVAEPPVRERSPLVGELQHRVRNILAVVRSVIARSAETSDTVEDLAAHLDGRIAALARVQATLVRNPRAGVDLEGLVRDELLAQNADEDKVRVSGPEISLPSKAAEVLTLAIHELATNAMKFGALSQASGNLEINWRLEDVETPRRRLELVWLETGVRVASGAPRREGFGTNLLKRRLPYELAGNAEVEFRPGGLVCRIGFPFAPANEPGPAVELTKAGNPGDFA
jgi:two-component sensor histidine kinase